ncbi:uncharacterized protein LOC106173579 [Lingula anatina]|uniref:Uncharacterized protein LOC106173579 n=1 Tax=Lingula anatina TaxID=7574 RepID=A0A1S3JJ97_LINAN|nr:uncharacterized protein LOC106173579 [Lingula anatina]|eukprot:XP_013410201.1 uncharacterized protein LOC106173579 [Lingula anatina]
MKRNVISDTCTICTHCPVIDSVIGLTNGRCRLLYSSADCTCRQLNGQYLGLSCTFRYMKVLILFVLVAVATAKPAENSIDRLARSLAEDEVMKRGVTDTLNKVAEAICVPVMDSVIGLTNSACAVLSASADSTCIQLADQYLGSFLSGLFSKPVESMCQNLAQLAFNECNKGTVQNLADSVCAKLADLPIIG